MNSKKAITLLVLATLLISLVPVIPVSAALTPDLLSGDSSYDTEVTATGDGVTPGATVELYWDYVQAWNGSAGKIASSVGAPSGSYSIDFDVPESAGGYHYVWVKDVTTGAIEPSGYLNIEPSIELSSEHGLPGDDITVTGYGFNASVDVDSIQFGNATGFVNQTSFASAEETDELGTWSDVFEVPDWNYGLNNVNATANGITCANITFRIGASISINKDEGPSGTLVRITGRGFNASKDITSTEVKFNGTSMYVVDSPVTTDADGDFVLDAYIPGYDGTDADPAKIDCAKLGEWDIAVNSTTVGFEITGLPEIEADPTFQVQGGSFTISGLNYTRASGKTVTVWLNDTKLGTVDTQSDGTWEKTFKVPAVTSGVYPLYATMDDYEINATMNYRVGIMLVILSSESGVTGSQVTLTATGFTEGEKWNMTIGGEEIDEVGAEADIKADGSIAQTITIPTLPIGVHSVMVYDIDADIYVETEFEVTETTSISADPVQVPMGFNVTLEGEYFSDESMDSPLTWWISNSTGEWEITVYNDTAVGGVSLLDDGTFEGIWTVGADTNFTVGSYTINVTDGKGLWAEMTYNIVDETVDIESRKSSFMIGETVAFDIESSFAVPDSYIKIYDPAGDLYWKTEVFDATKWVSLDLTKIVPFYSQTAGGNPMLLLDDAPLGEYEWMWYDSDDELVDEGVFTVTEAAADVISGQVEDLNNDIADLADQLTDVASDFSSLESDIADVASVAADAVAAAEAAAEAVTAVAATANTASEAAANAAEAAEAARDAASGLTTLVYGAIGAALVAALAAIVSLMQISRRIAG